MNEETSALLRGYLDATDSLIELWHTGFDSTTVLGCIAFLSTAVRIKVAELTAESLNAEACSSANETDTDKSIDVQLRQILTDVADGKPPFPRHLVCGLPRVYRSSIVDDLNSTTGYSWRLLGDKLQISWHGRWHFIGGFFPGKVGPHRYQRAISVNGTACPIDLMTDDPGEIITI